MDLVAAGTPLTHFSRGRTRLDEIVIHESVTRTRDETVRVLKRRALGVHFIVDRDGSVTQHAPLSAACAHAEGFGMPSLHNERSIAIEIVNRYYGVAARPGDDVIAAVWAHNGRYIMPTPAQLEAAWVLVRDVAEACDIPVEFPGWARVALVGPRRFFWGRLSSHEVPGIMAHHRWAHADGLFVEHYCLMRSLGHAAAVALDTTIASASSGSRRTIVPEVT